MPHIIVEYSDAIESEVTGVLPAVHDALAALGPEREKIKTRAISLHHHIVGEDVGKRMVHMTLKVWDSPDRTDEKMMGWLQALVDVIAAAMPPGVVVTAELVRLNTATYVTKHV